MRSPSTGAIVLLMLHASLLGCVRAWDAQPDGYEVIDGPEDPSKTEEWRQDWLTWRKMELRTARYDPAATCNVYNLPSAAWTQRNFVQAFLMLHDRAIYDRESKNFTVTKYVRQMEERVGRLDSVLLWPSYPNSGIDNRNQWDLLRTVPGGLPALRTLVDEFHSHNIRVILPYNPWDTNTRDEDNLADTVRMYLADVTMLQRMADAIGVDGFNGDTMYGVPKAFYNCTTVSSAPLLATPEGGVPTAFLSHNPVSWGYFWGYAHFPPVARAKFLESRHMVQICARWSLNKITDLQAAFFNGVGYVLWENVWGIWNRMTEREDAAARRIFHILRHFSFATVSAVWKPYTEALLARPGQQVAASEFPAEQQGVTLFTIVSASPKEEFIHLLMNVASTSGSRVFDVYHGIELSTQRNSKNQTVLPLMVEANGFAAVAVFQNDPDHAFAKFLDEMQQMAATPLHEFSMSRPLLKQTLVDATGASAEEHKMRIASSTLIDVDRASMVRIAGDTNWWFNVSGVQIEPVHEWTPTWPQFGTGVQFPWEDRPWNNHSVQLTISDFLIDKHPVTNGQYATFLRQSGYIPSELDRFLLHWGNRSDAATGQPTAPSSWTIPVGDEDRPVVYVAYEDAVSYARFFNKRLVHDWEWQYVASNGDEYTTYPWGNELDATRMPTVSHSKDPPLPEAVGSHGHGRTKKHEVEDLVGHVWQMTDQFVDEHTRGLLLRGGSHYRPIASTLADPNWYFPQAVDATKHNRILMLSESYDRSAMIGFRCAADREVEQMF
ncbi:TPA: hypothetical protein N0F65_003643 [Lagenidium giganteum]|uniref:Sulfatase-modifying factor enzyme-like domain-containing protein n=1 Tax=Lagenidium giganteum TaxID=4803 RepID=A0AAV2YJ51_9STRA|nr:TPA: hypothetical protein N0F65_003643 [Lagenidium giganteum]